MAELLDHDPSERARSVPPAHAHRLHAVGVQRRRDGSVPDRGGNL
jgi:hypothetical protein